MFYRFTIFLSNYLTIVLNCRDGHFSIFSSSSNFYSFLNLSLNVGKILNILKNSNDFIQFKVTRQGFLNIYFVKSLSPRNNGQFYLVSA